MQIWLHRWCLMVQVHAKNQQPCRTGGLHHKEHQNSNRIFNAGEKKKTTYNSYSSDLTLMWYHIRALAVRQCMCVVPWRRTGVLVGAGVASATRCWHRSAQKYGQVSRMTISMQIFATSTLINLWSHSVNSTWNFPSTNAFLYPG